MCLFIHETMFTIGESRAISHSDDTEQQSQQVAGNPRFSTEQTDVNLPSAIFKARSLLCNGLRLTFSSVCSFIISEISSFALPIGRVVRAPDWLRAESVRILFTMIFVDKSQYL